MKKTDLEKYTKLNEEFLSECDRVASILKDAPEYQRECGNISFANCFTLEDDTVDWEGDEYWNYGGHEYHSGCFPAEYLTMSDEELKKIVDKKIEEYNKRQEEKTRLKESFKY